MTGNLSWANMIQFTDFSPCILVYKHILLCGKLGDISVLAAVGVVSVINNLLNHLD